VEPPTASGDTIAEVANPLLYKFGLKLDFLILLVGWTWHHVW